LKVYLIDDNVCGLGKGCILVICIQEFCMFSTMNNKNQVIN